MIRNFVSVCSLLGVLLISSEAHADVFVPDGVLPGEQYHLVFVTAGVIDALSDDIDVYNVFAQTQAAMNATITGTDMGVTYNAIASTPDVAAIDNAPISAAVYLVGGSGALIATDSADMWDGSISFPISNNQFGNPDPSLVWTGTNHDGAPFPNFALGAQPPGGIAGNNTASMINAWITQTTNSGGALPLYALSSPITAPGAVPEPTSFVVLTGLGLLGVCRRRRRVA